MDCCKCLREIRNGHTIQHGLHKACFTEWFSLSSGEDFSNVIVKNGTSKERKKAAEESARNSSFFHGKFKKYSATLAGHSYILKVKDNDFPELPATEYLCNQIAGYLGLNIASYYYIRFEGKLETFVTKNFMRDLSQSDLVHLYHYLKKNQDFSCESIMKVIADKTGRLADIERFVELCLFDSLIGNNDRHGRNLALVQTKKGLFLSPFYDNPSYLGIEEDALLEAQIEPAGSIITSETKEPLMVHYVREFTKLGYGHLVAKFHAKVKLSEIFSLVDKAFLSGKRKKAIKALIERRQRGLTHGAAA